MTDHLLLFVGVLVLAGGVMSVLATVGWFNRSQVAAEWFTFHLAIDAVWAFAAAGMLLVDPSSMRLSIQLVVSSIALVAPVAWFGFILAYTGYDRWLARRRFALLSVLPVTVAVLGLFESTLVLQPDPTQTVVGGVSVVRGGAATPYLVALLYDYALLLAGLALVGRMVLSADDLFFGQAVAVTGGTLVPVVTGAVQIAGLVPVEGLPVTPAALAIYGVAFGYAMFHHRLLDLVPAIREIGESEAVQDLEEGIVIADGTGSVVEANRSAREAFDWTSAVLGSDVATLFDRLGAPAPDELPADFEHEGRVYDVRRSTVESASGRAVGRTFVFRDITDRRRRQQRLTVLNRVLRHNVRNEMTAAMGHAELIGDGVDASSAELAATVLERCERVVGLSEKAQTVEAMIETDAVVQSVALGDALEGVAATVRDDYGDFAFEVTGDAGVAVATRPFVFRTVLENVVENAVQHAQTDHPRVTVHVDASPDGCLIEVTDDGPGIPTDELAVLEQGTETDLAHGTGLGLWIIEWGVAELGGDVSFDATPTGTTVTLTVPAAEPGPGTTTRLRPSRETDTRAS
jgi:signal transduction histidine kinase